MALNLSYSGCCLWKLSRPCSNNGCYCDINCHNFNDCCNDIADIGCHPASSSSSIASLTPTDILGKTKSESHTIYISHIFYKIYNILSIVLNVDTKFQTPSTLISSTNLPTSSLSGFIVTPTPTPIGKWFNYFTYSS